MANTYLSKIVHRHLKATEGCPLRGDLIDSGLSNEYQVTIAFLRPGPKGAHMIYADISTNDLKIIRVTSARAVEMGYITADGLKRFRQWIDEALYQLRDSIDQED